VYEICTTNLSTFRKKKLKPGHERYFSGNELMRTKRANAEDVFKIHAFLQMFSWLRLKKW